MLLIVALALGPLALASIGQGLIRFQTRHEEIDANLLQMAIYTTSTERSILSGADQYLHEIALRPEVRDARSDCAQTLSDTLIGRAMFLNVVLLDAQGQIKCGASSEPLPTDYRKFSWWPALKKQNAALIGQTYINKASAQPVLPISLPLHDAAGHFTGAISASVNMTWLDRRMEFSRISPRALMVIVNRAGSVVASNRPIPPDLAREVAIHGWKHPNDIFAVTAKNGKWQWAAEPISHENMIVAFGVPEPGLFDVSRVYFLADILLPLLMIALASVAIWLGTEWLVIRWTTYLQRVSAAYGQNHFALELGELEDAPEEFRQLGYELKNMASSIRDRDRTVKRALAQEAAMAREIHHRVKNNLQIVSSLIGLYSQRIDDPAARTAFRQIVARVDALTLVHRLTEKSDTQPIVNMQALFAEMADQIRAIAAEAGKLYRLTLKVQDCSLTAATATPIALFAVEILTFALFLPDRNLALRDVRLTFGGDDSEHILLTIQDSSFNCEALRGGVPSPQRFLSAFADQLQANYRVDDNDDGGCTLSLRIPAHSCIPPQQADLRDDEDDEARVFQFRARIKGA
ncbi:MAG TPA: sensor histidine kinase [Rhizomicrobium sp.]|nr:sensor histidine kinase [Rhizomicrobium sp.]